MKNVFFFTNLIFLSALLSACSTISQNSAPENKSDTFNPELAQELGADDYGMRSYVFAMLKTGPNDSIITDEKKRAELFKGHFTNMGRLAEQGKLVLAGPYIEGGTKRGLFILNVQTLEEAQELIKTDPSIAAGIFEVELTKYYGSAALMKVNDIHKRIQKIAIN